MTAKQFALTLGLGLGAILLTAGQIRGQDRGRDNGEGRCGERREIVRLLGEKYGETRRFIALTGARQVIELYASSETGSWSLLITFPSGEACLIGAGDMIELGPDLLAPGEPA